MTKKGVLQRKTSSLQSSTHEHEAHHNPSHHTNEVEILTLEEKLKLYEEYRLSGDFEKDFVYLSSLLGYNIGVHRRMKFPTMRSSPFCESSNLCRLSDKKAIMDYHSESGKSTPRNFFVNDERKDDYSKKHAEITTEWESHKEIVKELYIRGWLLDLKIIDVLQKTSVELERLTVVNMWNVGLNDTTLRLLATCLEPCASLKSLSLDGNTSVEKQQFDLFLNDTEKLKIRNLSLRNCMLDSRGATNISKSLLTNHSLLVLNLCFNKLKDKDVAQIAESLRMNRTLLSLNLGANNITDEGVKSITDVISTFPLTDEEVVEHRKILVASRIDEKNPQEAAEDQQQDESKPPPKQRLRSSNKSNNKRPDSSNKKSPSKETTNKNTSSPTKTKESSGNAKKNQSNDTTPVKGQKLVKQKSSGRIERHNKSAGSATPQPPQAQEQFKHIDPLHEKATNRDGQLWIPGNRALINLNLSKNNITIKGIESLYSAIKYQVNYAQENNNTVGVGLLRLCLQKNNFDQDEPLYCSLIELMKIRDPFYKPIESEEAQKEEVQENIPDKKTGRHSNASNTNKNE